MPVFVVEGSMKELQSLCESGTGYFTLWEGDKTIGSIPVSLGTLVQSIEAGMRAFTHKLHVRMCVYICEMSLSKFKLLRENSLYLFLKGGSSVKWHRIFIPSPTVENSSPKDEVGLLMIYITCYSSNNDIKSGSVDMGSSGSILHDVVEEEDEARSHIWHRRKLFSATHFKCNVCDVALASIGKSGYKCGHCKLRVHGHCRPHGEQLFSCDENGAERYSIYTLILLLNCYYYAATIECVYVCMCVFVSLFLYTQ